MPALENELKKDPNNIAIKQLLGMSYFMISDFAESGGVVE